MTTITGLTEERLTGYKIEILTNEPESSFWQFLLKEKRNRTLLLIALIGSIAQFAIFKSLYPFADFFSDSYSYIYVASANLDIGIWPLGYSKFLRAFHFITHSDTAVVAFQYFFLEISSAYFLFTLLYFFKPSNTTRTVLFAFLFFNPLFLYISNYINSDPLFAALSLIWITQLIWIIHKPRLYQIFFQAVLLFACFTIRNNAYYYPILAILAFALAKQQIWKKVSGALLGILFIIPFILFQREAAYKLTGTKQFSLFTGWLLANNALYFRGNVDADSTLFHSAEAKELDLIAIDFYKHLKPGFNDYLSHYVANFFIRETPAPLKQYFKRNYKPRSELEIIKNWGQASVVFEEYGKTLLKKYPGAYLRYYMLPNAQFYFIPPLEKLEIYNLGWDEVWPVAQEWFDYKTDKVRSISKTAQGRILFFYPGLFLFINIFLIGTLLSFLISKKYKTVNRQFNYTVLLISLFQAVNFAFCVSATIIVLRYQFLPMILCLALGLLLFEHWNNREKTIHRY
jgi:hypothetical protein